MGLDDAQLGEFAYGKLPNPRQVHECMLITFPDYVELRRETDHTIATDATHTDDKSGKSFEKKSLETPASPANEVPLETA